VQFTASLGPITTSSTPSHRESVHQGASAARESFSHYAAARAVAARLGVNAGHDLDPRSRDVQVAPHLDEVIGHAIVSRAVFVGLATVIREYLDVLNPVL
jgi:pyridoxine 5'-phosphate synthase PdxJ